MKRFVLVLLGAALLTAPAAASDFELIDVEVAAHDATLAAAWKLSLSEFQTRYVAGFWFLPLPVLGSTAITWEITGLLLNQKSLVVPLAVGGTIGALLGWLVWSGYPAQLPVTKVWVHRPSATFVALAVLEDESARAGRPVDYYALWLALAGTGWTLAEQDGGLSVTTAAGSKYRLSTGLGGDLRLEPPPLAP